ncbi:DUF2842 domain-containing protein [Sphingomonas hylomeconis]|uniref:DUF2842 domain-containing protein n=2 Tax=Sphingomonas hylomeconis TaxID=1395958 RepID=A0ABV7SYC0_9SPHN
MTPSWRKPAGMLFILLLLAIWVVGVASLSNVVGGWHWLLQLAFYVFTGVIWLWVLPMRRLLQWMETGVWRRPSQ